MRTVNSADLIMKKNYFRGLPLLLFLLIFPWFYKKRPRVARRVIVRAKPQEIFPLLNDLRNWPLWTEWARRDGIHFSYDGSPAGVGAIQRWQTGRMKGVMRVTQSVPDDRVAYDLDINHGHHRFDGVLALEEIGEYTRVTWACKWELNANPYLRYLDLFMNWMLRRDFEAGLQNLKDLVESPHRSPV